MQSQHFTGSLQLLPVFTFVRCIWQQCLEYCFLFAPGKSEYTATSFLSFFRPSHFPWTCHFLPVLNEHLKSLFIAFIIPFIILCVHLQTFFLLIFQVNFRWFILFFKFNIHQVIESRIFFPKIFWSVMKWKFRNVTE